ncbi:uncharacterized protein LOC126780421 [Nymphalis io]|uniref:uncharacterized protein LOC126780421 n=1 Tax=Inachis io TaxID=171585 RepID=UPI0021679694|nr:uncharacterized protein LOC126780421 [Nymphalis io]
MMYLLSESTYKITITDDHDILDEGLLFSKESLETGNFTQEEIAAATKLFKDCYNRQWEALQGPDSDDDEDYPWPMPSFATPAIDIDEASENDWIDEDDYKVLMEVLDEIVHINPPFLEVPKYVFNVNISKYGSYDEKNNKWIVQLEYCVHHYPDDSTD